MWRSAWVLFRSRITVFALGNGTRMLQIGKEYISFIVLIGSLFVVSGGIHLRISGKSTPFANVSLLAIGAVAANVLGTTGASLILIRPFLRVNRYRLRGFHVVFFIFVVSNMGGALTPDWPSALFLGYLKGVPFWWVLETVWQMWIIALVIVLAVFFVMDTDQLPEVRSRPQTCSHFTASREGRSRWNAQRLFSRRDSGCGVCGKSFVSP